jgi:hypothetical protein
MAFTLTVNLGNASLITEQYPMESPAREGVGYRIFLRQIAFLKTDSAGDAHAQVKTGKVSTTPACVRHNSLNTNDLQSNIQFAFLRDGSAGNRAGHAPHRISWCRSDAFVEQGETWNWRASREISVTHRRDRCSLVTS